MKEIIFDEIATFFKETRKEEAITLDDFFDFLTSIGLRIGVLYDFSGMTEAEKEEYLAAVHRDMFENPTNEETTVFVPVGSRRFFIENDEPSR